MNFKHTGALKRITFMFMFGAATLLGVSATSYAQGHDQRHERRDLKDHQRQERYNNGGNYSTRDHQQTERRDLKHEQRDERSGGYYNNGGYKNGGYNNGGYNNGGYNNGGYYGNGNGHANNGYDPYYNNAPRNNRYPNGGYYGNGGYNRRRPHYDSGSFKNKVHHALGGH